MLIPVLNDIDNKVRLVPVTMTLEIKQQIESCVVIRWIQTHSLAFRLTFSILSQNMSKKYIWGFWYYSSLSQDLNPIEHIWEELDGRFQRRSKNKPTPPADIRQTTCLTCKGRGTLPTMTHGQSFCILTWQPSSRMHLFALPREALANILGSDVRTVTCTQCYLLKIR